MHCCGQRSISWPSCTNSLPTQWRTPLSVIKAWSRPTCQALLSLMQKHHDLPEGRECWRGIQRYVTRCRKTTSLETLYCRASARYGNPARRPCSISSRWGCRQIVQFRGIRSRPPTKRRAITPFARIYATRLTCTQFSLRAWPCGPRRGNSIRTIACHHVEKHTTLRRWAPSEGKVGDAGDAFGLEGALFSVSRVSIVSTAFNGVERVCIDCRPHAASKTCLLASRPQAAENRLFSEF